MDRYTRRWFDLTAAMVDDLGRYLIFNYAIRRHPAPKILSCHELINGGNLRLLGAIDFESVPSVPLLIRSWNGRSARFAVDTWTGHHSGRQPQLDFSNMPTNKPLDSTSRELSMSLNIQILDSRNVTLTSAELLLAYNDSLIDQINRDLYQLILRHSEAFQSALDLASHHTRQVVVHYSIRCPLSTMKEFLPPDSPTSGKI